VLDKERDTSLRQNQHLYASMSVLHPTMSIDKPYGRHPMPVVLVPLFEQWLGVQHFLGNLLFSLGYQLTKSCLHQQTPHNKDLPPRWASISTQPRAAHPATCEAPEIHRLLEKMKSSLVLPGQEAQLMFHVAAYGYENNSNDRQCQNREA
jgi:hypothetical protein